MESDETGTNRTDTSSGQLRAHTLREVLDILPAPAVYTDSDGRIGGMNADFAALTGYGEQELFGAPFRSLLMSASAVPLVSAPQPGESTRTFEARLLRRDGNSLTAEVRYRSFTGESPVPGYLMIVNDISGLYSRAEENEPYRLLMENLGELVVKCDLSLRVQFASPSYCERFGISLREHHGRRLPHLDLAIDPEGSERRLRSITSPPYRLQYQEELETNRGSRWIAWSARAIFDGEGEPEAILNVGRDITEQKHTEIALRQSEERYHRLFEEAIDGIALADPDTGTLIDCNRALCRLVHRNKDELIGAKQSILHPPDPEGRELSSSFRRHRSNEQGSEITTEVMTKEGEIRQVIIKANLISTAEGRYLQGIFHDVTEFQRAMEEIESLAKFPAENPNPILRVNSAGTIIYANDAASALLTAWQTTVNGALPSEPAETAAAALHRNESVEEEISATDRVFLMLFVPVSEHGYVNLYGRDITARKENEEQLNRMATIDELTGLLNRRHFGQLAEKEIERCTRFRSCLSILMFDIDHFKLVNDTYGHRAGDQVLRALGKKARELFRSIDLIARVGGEEFAVLLPQTSEEDAVNAAERARREVEAMRLSADGREISITISIGVSSHSDQNETVTLLLHHADIALYEAKHAGRNCVRRYLPPSDAQPAHSS